VEHDFGMDFGQLTFATENLNKTDSHSKFTKRKFSNKKAFNFEN